MSASRAERRRTARDKGPWQPHNPAEHQSVSPWQQLENHGRVCQRCRTGSVEYQGCEWLAWFASQNPELVTEAMELAAGTDGGPDGL